MKHPRNFDKILAALVAKIPKSFGRAMLLITNIGGFWFATLALTGLFIVAIVHNQRELLPSLVAITILTPLAELAKLATRRKRPETLYVEQMKFKTYSFPSGHSYVSALVAGYLLVLALIYLSGPLGWIAPAVLVGSAGLVGISRVYLGAHFPSDVLAGWCLAILVLYATSPFRNTLP